MQNEKFKQSIIIAIISGLFVLAAAMMPLIFSQNGEAAIYIDNTNVGSDNEINVDIN